MAFQHDEATPRKAGQMGRATGEVVHELRGWLMGVPRCEGAGVVIMPFRHRQIRRWTNCSWGWDFESEGFECEKLGI